MKKPVIKTHLQLLKEAHGLLEELLIAIDEHRKQVQHGHTGYNQLYKTYVKAEDWVDDHDFSGE